MRIPALGMILIALTGATGIHAADDLVIRQRVTGPMENEGPREEIQYWTATKRITDSTGGRRIVDLAAKTMTIVSKQKKTYQVVTFNEIQQETKALQARLEELPAETRKMIDGDVTVKTSGKTRKILGYTATEYVVRSELATGEMWTTEELAPPGDVSAWQDALAAMSGPAGPGGKLATALARVKGVPLRSSFTTILGPRKLTVVTEVVEIATKSPPSEMTTVPTGFEKDTPEQHRGEHRATDR
jgi:Domain of unknown function (DUF4412)